MDKKAFGHRLLKLMRAKGWWQSELAKRADLPRNNISTYVRGRSFPSDVCFLKLARAFGLPPDELWPDWQSVVRGGERRAEATPDLAVHSLGGGEAMLNINRKMPLERALRILAIAAE